MDLSPVEMLLPIGLGISLAAATGLRVFMPLLLTALAMRLGWLPASDGFAWVSTGPALLMLGVAALAEILAYYVPLLDNLLDTIAAPLALVAGVAISAAVMTDLPPMLKWTLAIIAGGGAASITQGMTTALRGGSTILTGGLGNAAIATFEAFGAIGLVIAVLAFPALALLVVLALVWLAWRVLTRQKPVDRNV